MARHWLQWDNLKTLERLVLLRLLVGCSAALSGAVNVVLAGGQKIGDDPLANPVVPF